MTGQSSLFNLGAYEKQMRTLTTDNDNLKQYIQETERTMTQLKRDNEELQQKVNKSNETNNSINKTYFVFFKIIYRKLIKNFQYFFLLLIPHLHRIHFFLDKRNFLRLICMN